MSSADTVSFKLDARTHPGNALATEYVDTLLHTPVLAADRSQMAEDHAKYGLPSVVLADAAPNSFDFNSDAIGNQLLMAYRSYQANDSNGAVAGLQNALDKDFGTYACLPADAYAAYIKNLEQSPEFQQILPMLAATLLLSKFDQIGGLVILRTGRIRSPGNTSIRHFSNKSKISTPPSKLWR